MKKENKLPENIFTKIHETVGSASMCWTNIKGAGEFRSELASEVAQELCDYIHRHTVKKPITLLERFKYFLNSAGKGMLMYFVLYLFHATLLYIGLSLWVPNITWIQAFGIFITLRLVKIGIIDLSTTLHHKNDDNKSEKP